jgi:predicted TIM-barrel fold metal-dependent hydrolase
MADNARDFQALPLPADALVKMLETNARALFP